MGVCAFLRVHTIEVSISNNMFLAVFKIKENFTSVHLE